MSAKTQHYADLADRTVAEITSDAAHWAAFLCTAARNHKYSFEDQVMIHAQRPRATACAGYDFWKRRMRRYVRARSVGIALLRQQNGKASLAYVFDISDTGAMSTPCLSASGNTVTSTGRLWQNGCPKSLPSPPCAGLAEQLIRISVQLADTCWHDHRHNIMRSLGGSLLEELDELNVGIRFTRALTVSTAYLLMVRCGLPTKGCFTEDDFAYVREFDTRLAATVLGCAVHDCSELVLRQIERAIKGGSQKQKPAPAVDAAPPLTPVTPEDEPEPPALPALNVSPPPETEKAPPPSSPLPETPPQLPAVRPAQEAKARGENFRITDDHLGKGGPKEKFRANLDAIRTLKAVEAEGRGATAEEQEVLSRYVGWGGLPDAFDPDKENWSKEYTELKEVLTPEEYESARGSVLNAHYTSPAVIRAVYEALEHIGFQSGNILEPSCGVGSFFGCLPESMAGSKLYGVELDSISGRIARLLYPRAHITVAGFETTDRRDFYDLAVGNVPFGNYQVNDRAYNKLGFSIHNYFFAKALDQVRPGGIVAFLTSRYTMDSKDTAVRQYLASGRTCWGPSACPTTPSRPTPARRWCRTSCSCKSGAPRRSRSRSGCRPRKRRRASWSTRYFQEHPEMVLGQPAAESTQYGKQDYTVAPIPGADLVQLLRDAVGHVQGRYAGAEPPELEDGAKPAATLPADPGVKNYSYALVGGQVYYRENSVMVRPELTASAEGRVRGMIALRNCVHGLIALQMDEHSTDAAIQAKQQELGRLYDAFSAQYGLINDRANRQAFDKDSAYYLLCSLEILDDDGNLKRKADMFTKRTIQSHRAVTHVDTAAEALAVSIGERARVDLEFMAQLMGGREHIPQIVSDLSGVIFKKSGERPL